MPNVSEIDSDDGRRRRFGDKGSSMKKNLMSGSMPFEDVSVSKEVVRWLLDKPGLWTLRETKPEGCKG